MISSGYIPNEILYICKPSTHTRYIDKTRNTLDVYDAFPTDPEKETTVSTARKWAGNTTGVAGVEFRHPNTPIEKIQIIDTENRGGRYSDSVFKVVIDDKFHVDLRLQQMMEVISHGMIENGIISGVQMIWARVRSTMMLIRVGGSDHRELSEFINLSEIVKGKKKMPYEDLKTPGMYCTKKQKYILLGEHPLYNISHDGRINASHGVVESFNYKQIFNPADFINVEPSHYCNLPYMDSYSITGDAFLAKLEDVDLKTISENIFKTYEEIEIMTSMFPSVITVWDETKRCQIDVEPTVVNLVKHNCWNQMRVFLYLYNMVSFYDQTFEIVKNSPNTYIRQAFQVIHDKIHAKYSKSILPIDFNVKEKDV